MQTVYGLRDLAPELPESTVCIGVFDGVHLGHQRVIAPSVADARASGRASVVLTFDRHPLSIVRPEDCPKAVLAPGLKLRKIAGLGPDAAVILPFDTEFSEQSPEDFCRNVLGRLNAACVVVGHDFGFGKDRRGTAEWLNRKIPTIVVEQFELDGRRVSSTQVRRDIAEGMVEEAARLLGGPPAIAGLAVKGSRLGSKLGVPTINLAPIVEQVIPKDGVYAGSAEVAGGRYAAALSVGWRPTVPGAGFAVEAHLLDFPERETYGREIVVEFVARLRDEVGFASLDELGRQMRIDIEQARRVLEASPR